MVSVDNEPMGPPGSLKRQHRVQYEYGFSALGRQRTNFRSEHKERDRIWSVFA